MNDKVEFKKLKNKVADEAFKIRIIPTNAKFLLTWTYPTEEPIFYLTTVKQNGFYFG